MSSLTDVARGTFSQTVKRTSRRARFAPYISAAFALVAVAILVLFAYQAGFFAQFIPEAPKPPLGKPAEQITVSQSTITGFDSQSRPYSVTARSGVQDEQVRSRVHLTTVSGESQRNNGETVKMKANSGIYDTEAKMLDLAGSVEIASEGHFIAHMDAARVDVHQKTLVSHSPVKVDLPDGSTIEAKALQVSNEGDNILFFDGVRARFRSNGAKGDGSP